MLLKWWKGLGSIHSLPVKQDIIGRYITRTDQENIRKVQEMGWRPKVVTLNQDKLIRYFGSIQRQYLLLQKDHPVRVSDILDNIYLIAKILGDQDWLPLYVNKIVVALKATQEEKCRNASENSSQTILLAFKLMCPKPNHHLNAAGSNGGNGPTKKACRIISNALQGSITDCGSHSFKPWTFSLS